MTPHTFEFSGTAIPFLPGQTVGAALMAAGIVSWRTTRFEHRPRGLFCGIGICYDCLITVDGVHSERACLVPARDGIVVTPTDPDEPVALRVAATGTTDGREVRR